MNAVRDGWRVVRTIFTERDRNRRLQNQSAQLAAAPASEWHVKPVRQIEESVGEGRLG